MSKAAYGAVNVGGKSLYTNGPAPFLANHVILALIYLQFSLQGKKKRFYSLASRDLFKNNFT